MWYPHIDDRVRLTHDLPDLSLHSGTVGLIRSVWFAPSCAYEVEFHVDGGGSEGCVVRTLLAEWQFEADEASRLAECSA